MSVLPFNHGISAEMNLRAHISPLSLISFHVLDVDLAFEQPLLSVSTLENCKNLAG